MSGWELQAKWPVEKGDEITSAHFEDLRKTMWSIIWILEPDAGIWDFDDTPYSEGDLVWWAGSEWVCIDNDPTGGEPGDSESWIEYPQPWDSAKIYYQYDRVLFNLFNYLDIKNYSRWVEYAAGDFVKKGGDYYVSLKNTNSDNPLSDEAWWNKIVDTQFQYMLGGYRSRGIPPVKNSPWYRVARQAKYCDFDTNSGCYDFFGRGPAYLQLPPQVNKYTRAVKIHRQTGYVVPTQLMYAKKYEAPVELTINKANYNGMQALITGPIGARYVEYHPYSGSGPMFGPFYYPYYISSTSTGTPGAPYLGDGYYERKMQGYQSFIEWFMEARGWSFQWPLEGAVLQDALDAESNPFWRMRSKLWGCNASAFEKALELTGDYDWYLDLKFPPDPDMNKIVNPALWRKGAWRKTWKYSFGCPLGLMWPQEKGDPPYLTKGDSWWADWSNCQKAYQEALSELSVGDLRHIAERHWPMWIPRADALAREQQEEPEEPAPDDDFQEAIDHLIAMYEEILRTIMGEGVPPWTPNKVYVPGDYVQHWAVYYQCIEPHTSSLDDLETWASWLKLWKKVEIWELYKDLIEWQPKVDLCFEIATGLINQMKQVLDCLKWVTVSPLSYSCKGSYHFIDELGPSYFHTGWCEGWSWGQFTKWIMGEVASSRGDVGGGPVSSPIKDEANCTVLGCSSVRTLMRAHPIYAAALDSDGYSVTYTFTGSETERFLKHVGLYGKNARIVISASGNYDLYGDGDFCYPDPFPCEDYYEDDEIHTTNITIGNIFSLSTKRKETPTRGWINVPYLAKGETFEVELGYTGGRWDNWPAPPDPEGGQFPSPLGESWFLGQVYTTITCDPMLVEIDPLKVDLGCVPVE